MREAEDRLDQVEASLSTAITALTDLLRSREAERRKAGGGGRPQPTSSSSAAVVPSASVVGASRVNNNHHDDDDDGRDVVDGQSRAARMAVREQAHHADAELAGLRSDNARLAARVVTLEGYMGAVLCFVESEEERKRRGNRHHDASNGSCGPSVDNTHSTAQNSNDTAAATGSASVNAESPVLEARVVHVQQQQQQQPPSSSWPLIDAPLSKEATAAVARLVESALRLEREVGRLERREELATAVRRACAEAVAATATAAAINKINVAPPQYSLPRAPTASDPQHQQQTEALLSELRLDLSRALDRRLRAASAAHDVTVAGQQRTLDVLVMDVQSIREAVRALATPSAVLQGLDHRLRILREEFKALQLSHNYNSSSSVGSAITGATTRNDSRMTMTTTTMAVSAAGDGNHHDDDGVDRSGGDGGGQSRGRQARQKVEMEEEDEEAPRGLINSRHITLTAAPLSLDGSSTIIIKNSYDDSSSSRHVHHNRDAHQHGSSKDTNDTTATSVNSNRAADREAILAAGGGGSGSSPRMVAASVVGMDSGDLPRSNNNALQQRPGNDETNTNRIIATNTTAAATATATIEDRVAALERRTWHTRQGREPPFAIRSVPRMSSSPSSSSSASVTEVSVHSIGSDSDSERGGIHGRRTAATTTTKDNSNISRARPTASDADQYHRRRRRVQPSAAASVSQQARAPQQHDRQYHQQDQHSRHHQQQQYHQRRRAPSAHSAASSQNVSLDDALSGGGGRGAP